MNERAFVVLLQSLAKYGITYIFDYSGAVKTGKYVVAVQMTGYERHEPPRGRFWILGT